MIKMKKINLAIICMVLSSIVLTSCAGRATVKPAPVPAPPAIGKSTPAPATPQASTGEPSKPGGYYLDDGPGDNPPKDIDGIPNATPRKEAYLSRANKPYIALGTTYTPMPSYQPYKARGVASWYGKRYHGKNTSSGEVYDMFSMTAAHPTLPLPSYIKVTNPANGRAVIVRVNDRGPFKSSRLVDLSYAAAYKLRFSNQGSSVVEVEAIDPENIANFTVAPLSATNTAAPATYPANTQTNTITKGYYVQAGAFKNEVNANALSTKIQGLNIAQNGGINKVYNNGLHRLKLGPYESRQVADQVAGNIRRELNVSTIIVNQP
jgi:rare lipoprotein A